MAKGYRIKMTLKMDAPLKTYKTDIYADGDYLKEIFEDRVGRKMTAQENDAILWYLFSECVGSLNDGINERVAYAVDGYLSVHPDKLPSRGRKK